MESIDKTIIADELITGNYDELIIRVASKCFIQIEANIKCLQIFNDVGASVIINGDTIEELFHNFSEIVVKSIGEPRFDYDYYNIHLFGGYYPKKTVLHFDMKFNYDYNHLDSFPSVNHLVFDNFIPDIEFKEIKFITVNGSIPIEKLIKINPDIISIDKHVYIEGLDRFKSELIFKNLKVFKFNIKFYPLAKSISYIDKSIKKCYITDFENLPLRPSNNKSARS